MVFGGRISRFIRSEGSIETAEISRAKSSILTVFDGIPEGDGGHISIIEESTDLLDRFIDSGELHDLITYYEYLKENIQNELLPVLDTSSGLKASLRRSVKNMLRICNSTYKKYLESNHKMYELSEAVFMQNLGERGLNLIKIGSAFTSVKRKGLKMFPIYRDSFIKLKYELYNLIHKDPLDFLCYESQGHNNQYKVNQMLVKIYKRVLRSETIRTEIITKAKVIIDRYKSDLSNSELGISISLNPNSVYNKFVDRYLNHIDMESYNTKFINYFLMSIGHSLDIATYEENGITGSHLEWMLEQYIDMYYDEKLEEKLIKKGNKKKTLKRKKTKKKDDKRISSDTITGVDIEVIPPSILNYINIVSKGVGDEESFKKYLKKGYFGKIEIRTRYIINYYGLTIKGGEEVLYEELKELGFSVREVNKESVKDQPIQEKKKVIKVIKESEEGISIEEFENSFTGENVVQYYENAGFEFHDKESFLSSFNSIIRNDKVSSIAKKLYLGTAKSKDIQVWVPFTHGVSAHKMEIGNLRLVRHHNIIIGFWNHTIYDTYITKRHGRKLRNLIKRIENNH